MSPAIYRYVVRSDCGTAPRPFGGICSLAICKPGIRRTAMPGDWVIGFRSRRPGEVIYAMQMSERLTLADYWRDPRFRDRRPDRTAYPDNIYEPDAGGVLRQVRNNGVHTGEDVQRDVGGRNVLLGERYWYFGRNSVPLPNQLMHLVHTTQGHVVHKNRQPGDAKALADWLGAWPPGIHGQPVDDWDADARTGELGRSRCLPKRPMAPASACARLRSASGARRQRSRGKKACRSTEPIGPVPRRLVLSRKGFDSGYGRMPSPILPDGRMLPLPIPAEHDSFRFADLSHGLPELGALLSDLSNGIHSIETRIHLDPDLDRESGLRLHGWRPSLGQTGTAQAHLTEQGVGAGDVFLFFGWFRRVEHTGGRWRFVRGAPDLHVLFGWLEVDELLPVVIRRDACLARHPWIADHPHVANRAHYTSPLNTLYIGRSESRWLHGRPGGGLFRQFSEDLQLTVPGASRSVWRLPAWFHPTDDCQPLTYHRDQSRWIRIDDMCRLRSVAKGQEFVLQLDGRRRTEADAWIRNLLLCAT